MKNQIIKMDDNIKQIMYALIGTDKPNKESITRNGNICFMNFTDEIDVEFFGIKNEFYCFGVNYSNHEDDIGEDRKKEYFIKIHDGVAYEYKDNKIYSLIVCLNKCVDTLHIKTGVQYIGDNAFNDCKIKTLVIPNSVWAIEEYCFRFCDIKNIIVNKAYTRVYIDYPGNSINIIEENK